MACVQRNRAHRKTLSSIRFITTRALRGAPKHGVNKMTQNEKWYMNPRTAITQPLSEWKADYEISRVKEFGKSFDEIWKDNLVEVTEMNGKWVGEFTTKQRILREIAETNNKITALEYAQGDAAEIDELECFVQDLWRAYQDEGK